MQGRIASSILIATSLATLSGCKGGEGTAATFGLPTYYSWMSSEIISAWNDGFFGQGSRLHIIDDFLSSDSVITGDLGSGVQAMHHGDWTSEQISLLAPMAAIDKQDFSNTQAITLETSKLNIINLSYGMIGQSGETDIQWNPRETSIIRYATNGSAVVVKAAGNTFGNSVDGIYQGNVDYLNLDLIGAQSAIFVGALNSHGTAEQPATIADYSSIAGTNTIVQNQFLVVGVTGNETGLYGTSFAAPIVSGYAAILGSKFTGTSPTQITNQLLNTARIDTIFEYSAKVHGRGEVSISRALAPGSIQ